MSSETSTYIIVMRSAWERDDDRVGTHEVEATSLLQAVKQAEGITDSIVVGVYPADEEEHLRKALTS